VDEIRRYKNELFADVTGGLDKKDIETVINVLLRMKANMTTEPNKATVVGE
jgi:hypothetical protein